MAILHSTISVLLSTNISLCGVGDVLSSRVRQQLLHELGNVSVRPALLTAHTVALLLCLGTLAPTSGCNDFKIQIVAFNFGGI